MRKILVVDDSRLIRKAARRMLEQLHFEVSEAEHGVMALSQCRAEMPAGILLDWNMPEMDGLSFLKVLRTVAGGLAPKVLFCTTETDFSHINQALAAGADEYLMKPFDSEILTGKLASVGLV